MRQTIRGHGLFPIALLTLLVGLTFWLQRASEVKEGFRDSRLRHDPDYIAENFTVRRFAPTGGLQSVLVAEKMLHYPDDETTVVIRPHISYFNGARRTLVSAQQGLMAADAREIALVGKVRGVREATRTNPETVFTTSHLTLFPDDEIVRTSAAVTLIQGASVVRGVGLEADYKTGVYKLLSQVSSTIEKKRRPRP